MNQEDEKQRRLIEMGVIPAAQTTVANPVNQAEKERRLKEMGIDITQPFNAAAPEDDRNLLQKAGDAVVSAAKGNAEFDFPEIAEFARDNQGERFVSRRFGGTPERAASRRTAREQRFRNLAQRMFLPFDNSRIEEIVGEEFPEAVFRRDRNGNPFVRLREGNFYLNRSGISGQDFGRTFTEASLAAAGSAKVAKVLPEAVGVVGKRALGGLAGGAGASAATDVLAGEEVDILKAGITGGTAGSLEVLLPGLAKLGAKPLQKLGAILRKPRVLENGKLTSVGRDEIAALGINPDEVRPETVTAFFDLLKTTDDSAAAFRQAEAQTLPESITLTGGQATQNQATRSLESQAARGGFGEDSAALVNETFDGQQAALRSNVDEIGNDIAGREVRPGQGLEEAQNRLLRDKAFAKSQIDEAFDFAREQKAFFPAEEVPKLANDITRALRTFPVSGLPKVQGLVDDLGRIITVKNTRAISIGVLEGYRTRVSHVALDATDAQSAAAAKRILSTYDDVLENRLKDALLIGDDRAIKAWKDARSLRKRFGEVFEQGDAVKTLTAKARDGSNRLLVEPHEAANYLFGRSQIGAKVGLKKDLTKLRETLGRTSPEWNGIRAEAFLRFFRNDTGDGLINAAGFAKELGLAEKNALPVMEILFTRHERLLLNQLKRVSSNITSTKKIAGDTNPSGTAAAVLARFNDAFGSIGGLASGVAERFLSGVRRANSSLKAGQSIQGQLPPRQSPLPTGTGSGLGVLEERSRSS